MPAPSFQPFDAAVAKLGSRSPVASALKSAEWAAVPLALRERAFFSAQVANAETVAKLQGALTEALKLEGDTFMDPSKFVAVMRQHLGAEPGDTGELTDLASRRRLELIYRQNIESAQEYGRWKAGNDPDLLDAYPAQELIRVESREVERDWEKRWADAGGRLAGGRMVALKNDPVWAKLSRFGTPWPPFDFNSGMGVEDVDRAEAEALGLLKPGDPAPETPAVGFNSDMQASVTRLDPAVVEAAKASFGGAVQDKGGILQWVEGRHSLAIALDVPANHPHADALRRAAAAMSEVHDYTGDKIGLTPVGKLAGTANGVYRYSAETKGIDINPKGAAPELTFAHEVGHMLDHRLFGQNANLGTELKQPELKALMASIKASDEAKLLASLAKGGISKEERKYYRYLSSEHELFARAYAQYIATESRAPAMLDAVAARHTQNRSQWAEASFAPIQEAFNALFKKRGYR